MGSECTLPASMKTRVTSGWHCGRSLLNWPTLKSRFLSKVTTSALCIWTDLSWCFTAASDFPAESITFAASTKSWFTVMLLSAWGSVNDNVLLVQHMSCSTKLITSMTFWAQPFRGFDSELLLAQDLLKIVPILACVAPREKVGSDVWSDNSWFLASVWATRALGRSRFWFWEGSIWAMAGFSATILRPENAATRLLSCLLD